MSTSNSNRIDIRLTSGMFALAVVLGSVLYGIILLQSGLYLGRWRQTDKKHAVLVAVLAILGTVEWILEVWTLWWFFVENFSNPVQFATVIRPLQIEAVLVYTISFIGQMFFIRKIWILSESHILGWFLTLVAIAGWVTGVGIGALVLAQNNISPTHIDTFNYIQKVSSTVVEVLIAGLMVYLFKREKNGVSQTDNVLSRLIVFAVSRGVAVGIVQLVFVSTVFLDPYQIWLIPHVCIGKVATNAVLASLNVREIVRVGLNMPTDKSRSVTAGDIVFTNPNSRNTTYSRYPQSEGHASLAVDLELQSTSGEQRIYNPANIGTATSFDSNKATENKCPVDSMSLVKGTDTCARKDI